MSDQTDTPTVAFSDLVLRYEEQTVVDGAMIHDPGILLLDEPELGLDTDGLEIFDRILLESRDRGRLLLVASHRADRLEDLADTIHRFEKGRVLIPDEDEAGESKRIRAVEPHGDDS